MNIEFKTQCVHPLGKLPVSVLMDAMSFVNRRQKKPKKPQPPTPKKNTQKLVQWGLLLLGISTI